MYFDDDDDTTELPDPVIDDKNLGDEIGTKIGEGHDPIEDDVL